MSTPVPDALLAAASAYEELHVPALFRRWAAPVLDAAEVGAGQRVLDVACGTGVLARAAAARVGDEGRLCGLDPAPGMLAVAERLASAAGLSIDWRMGSAESMPFDDGAFDAVVSQFGAMFFVDRGAALREMTRVVRTGGRVAVAVWDTLENTPAYAALVELLERMAGPAAADALRAPFALGERKLLEESFEGAGLTSVRATTETGTARFPTLRSMVEADLRGWLPVMGVELDDELIARILAESEVALRSFVTDTGQAVFDAPAHIVVGRKKD